jgi:hypothetical protein
LTGGAGVDRFVVGTNSAVLGEAQISGAVLTDVITDFLSGTDKLSLAQATSFNGVYANLTSGLAGVVTTANGGVAGQSFFSVADNQVYVVNATNGTLTSTDTVVKLSGVTTITAADLLLGATGGASLTLTAAGQSVTATSTTPGASTTFNDSITGTIALVGGATTLVGGLGTDSVTLSTNGTFAAPVTFNSIETLVLSGAGANTITINAGTTNHALKNITGGAAADGVTVTNLVAGGTVSLGAGADSLAAMTVAIATGTGSSFVGGTQESGTVDSVTFAAAQTYTATSLDQLSGFESVDFAAPGATSVVTLPTTNSLTTISVDTTTAALTVTGTGAQLTALTSVSNVNGTNTLNFTLSDTTAGSLNIAGWTIGGTGGDIDVITFAGNNNTLTTNATNIAKITGTVAAAGAGDTLVITADATVDATKFAAFEVLTASGTDVDITDSGVAVARTLNGDAGANIFTLAGISAAKTVNLGTGGADSVGLSVDATAVATINGFTVGSATGADTLNLLTAADGALTVAMVPAVVATGATVTASATDPSTGVILSGAAFQVSGTLTQTTDAGAVEAAIIAAGLAGITNTTTDNGKFFMVALDNGTDTGVYRVAVAGGASTAWGQADDLSVSLIAILVGVSDCGTIVAANIV